MALADDLLSQAKQLASQEQRRPKQASLRRSISAAYYALFHLLVNDACARFAPGDLKLQARIGPSFVHGHMSQICKSVSSRNPGKFLAGLLPQPLPKDLVLVARVFERLQVARHAADYDNSVRHDRLTALTYIKEADMAFKAWKRIRGEEYARAFLLSLLLASRN